MCYWHSNVTYKYTNAHGGDIQYESLLLQKVSYGQGQLVILAQSLPLSLRVKREGQETIYTMVSLPPN